MKRRILPAKVTRPVVSNAYIRKMLFRLLDEGSRHKAIWISGPPGSGKTTLVSSYIESRDIPSLWCQIDSNDTKSGDLLSLSQSRYKEPCAEKTKASAALYP